MHLALSESEGSAILHALENYLKSLEAMGSEEKGVKLEIATVKELIERMHSLPGAPGT
jgi:hypothetical protein